MAFATLSFAAPDPIDSWREWPTISVHVDPPVIEVVTLRVVWRLDCATDTGPLIGRITGAAPGHDGRVLLIDSQTPHVLVVTRDGTIERVLGQRGEGPGEVGRIYRTVALADGRIGMVGGAEAPALIFGGRGDMSLLDEADDPAGSWVVAGEVGSVPMSMVRELRCALPHILVASARTLVSAELDFLSIRELALVSPPDGRREVVARQVHGLGSRHSQVVPERDAYEPFADGRCDVHASGRTAFAPERDRWLVCVRETDGSGVVLERPWIAVERTDEQITAAMDLHGVTRDLILDREPVVGRVRWRPNGRLWVEPRGLPPADGAIACFDELSAEGKLLRRVQVKVPGVAARDQFLVMEDGRFVVLRGFGPADEEGVDSTPEVVLLEM